MDRAGLLGASRRPKARTMRPVADKLAELGVVPSITDETVRPSSKKAN